MTTYRVYYLPEPIREKATAKRQQAHITWEELLLQSVSTELPVLVEAIQGLGLVPGKQKTRLARLPVSEEVLQALAAGSAQTGLPQRNTWRRLTASRQATCSTVSNSDLSVSAGNFPSCSVVSFCVLCLGNPSFT